MSVVFEELVSFGNKTEVLTITSPDESHEVGGTVMGQIQTVKKMLPGEYNILISTLSGEEHEGLEIAIIYHASVDPMKVKAVFGEIDKVIPCCEEGFSHMINRYDWLCSCSDDDDDSDEDQTKVDVSGFIFIVNTSAREHLKNLKPMHLVNHPKYPNRIKILKFDGKPQGFAFRRGELYGVEYDYGLLFEENLSNRNFAFVYHDACTFNTNTIEEEEEQAEQQHVHHHSYDLALFTADS